MKNEHTESVLEVCVLNTEPSSLWNQSSAKPVLKFLMSRINNATLTFHVNKFNKRSSHVSNLSFRMYRCNKADSARSPSHVLLYIRVQEVTVSSESQKTLFDPEEIFSSFQKQTLWSLLGVCHKHPEWCPQVRRLARGRLKFLMLYIWQDKNAKLLVKIFSKSKSILKSLCTAT